MHLFMRAIGFGDVTDGQIEGLIEAGIDKMKDESHFMQCNHQFARWTLLIPTSESTGLCVYGRLEGERFVKEYYFPLFLGEEEDSCGDMTMERHLDKESYEVICEDLKVGVTLIFYLQNLIGYLDYVQEELAGGSLKGQMFELGRKNLAEKQTLQNRKVALAGLSVGGMILLPASKPKTGNKSFNPRQRAKDIEYSNLVNAARNGDQEAIESLTIQDLDAYTAISRRIVHEDVLSIVESSFMPCGVECDQYSVIGEILEIERQTNAFTQETMCLMKLNCNDIVFDLIINESDLVGEPALGRRFKGNVWLQGEVHFSEN